jgi:site-specific DNA recombinase
VLETGKISLNDVGPRIRVLKEQYEKLQRRKEELNILMAEQTLEVPSLEEVRECAVDLRNSLERGSLAERKAFIRSFVKEIRIEGDEAKLTYILPMLPRGLREETESVLAIVNHGGPSWTRTTDPSLIRTVL